MRLPIYRLLPALILSFLFSATAWSGTFTIFGPKTYVRGTGAPVTVTDNFTVPNPNVQFTLRVHNGGLTDSATDFVSSTTITVNGVVVVAPNDLNQNIAEVDKPVTLLASNEIDVQVRGAAGGALAVDIVEVDNTPPTITASANPAANAAGWNNTNVTVTFTCADALSGIAACAPATVASVEGANQIISGTATDNAGNTATAQVTLNIDKTPPVITVASPANNSTVATSTLQLSGTVSDALSGVAFISCNGTAVQLQAGAFSCSVSLVAGANNITVSSTDVAGNTATSLLSITLANGGQPAITDFTPKSGPVGTLITLTGTNLTSGNTAQVTLSQQGGGTIAAPISTASPANISFVIPAGAASGLITVTASNNSTTSATALNVTAASSFTVTAGPATAILLQGKSAAYSVSVDSTDGFTQLAKLSVSGLPSGVTATLSPSQIAAGQISILTVNAPANQTVGTSTLTISASAIVDGISSTQTANVNLSVQPVTTSFFGRVVESDTVESPLPGIGVKFLGVDDAGNPTGCSGKTAADAAGNFIFTNLPDACTGRQLVWYIGTTALDREVYAGVNLAYTIIKGQATGPELVHLPRIDNAETVMVKQNAPADQIFGFKTMPGISVTVYAGTVFTLPSGQQPDPFPFTGVEVPVDRLPDAPVDGPGTLRAFIVAFQPDNTASNQPVAVSFPNFINTPPGVNMELDTLDPVVGDLVKYGTGTVSADATQVVPDLDPAHPGHRFGIQHFDWHGPMSPAPNDINPSPDPDNPDEGDPVDTASGLFVMSKTDIIFGGARGIVTLVRTYRTLAGTPGPFGVGTSHNYSYQLNTFNFIQGQGFITLIMPDGNQFQFVQQPNGTFINTTIPALKGAVLTAAPPSFVMRYKDGATFTFQNPATGGRVAYLASIKDRNGNVTTMVRGNPNDPIQITQIVDPVGRQLNLTYDNFDRITSMTDPIGRVVSYTYNGQGTLDTVTDATGGITRYAYDAQNRITSITDPRGITYLQNVYDGNGKVVKQIAADGGITQFAYTLLNSNASVTLGADATTTNTSPVLLTVVTDPLGNQTTYHFNAQGFLIDMTDALGQKTIYERAPGSNLLLSVTDPLNRTTVYTYDSSGNLTSVSLMAGTAESATVNLTYESLFNQVTSITDPIGRSLKIVYDGQGNPISSTDPMGHTTTQTFDANGELIAATDPLGNKTQFTYSAGALVAITDAANKTITRSEDAVGRVTSATSPLNQSVRYSYTPLNQLAKVTDPLGGVSNFQYDPNGNLIAITDPSGHATTNIYDVMDRLATRVDPLSRSEQYSFDLAGNLTKVVDRRSVVTTYKYDVLNRRILSLFGVSGTTQESSIQYTYDAVGRLVRADDSAAGPIVHVFDNFDRLVSESVPAGSITYQYDSAGQKTTTTVAGQQPTSYSYDPAGRLTAISQESQQVHFTYDDAGRRTSLTLPNGITANYTYDQNSRPLTFQYAAGTQVLGDLSYAYDASGHRTRVSGSLAKTIPPQAADAAYDVANELMLWNGTSLTYDQNGNLLSDGTNQFLWDARNQLVALNGKKAQYDAFGRRIRNPQGITTLYDSANVVQELSGPTLLATRLLGLSADEFFSRSDSAGTVTPLVDASGTVLALTDRSATVQSQYVFGAFGGTTSSGTPNSNPYQYTGRENDSDGIYYYRARYYNPVFSRFISEDPLQFGSGMNFYSYAKDDPTDFNDPFGLDVTITFWPGDAHGYGHVGAGVNSNQTSGFYPTSHPTCLVFDCDVNGQVLNDRKDHPDVTPQQVTLPTTPEQDKAMQKVIDDRTKNPGKYNLYGRNCAKFVEDVLRAGGLKDVPDTKYPEDLFNNLKNRVNNKK
ncbi:MAG TPA: RHS repeat-associated core domain-containing protein [Candidatus Angelobacter sp.]